MLTQLFAVHTVIISICSPLYAYSSLEFSVHTVKAGDILYGRITYDGNNNMIIYHKDMTDGWDVTTTIPVQMGKNGQYKASHSRLSFFSNCSLVIFFPCKSVALLLCGMQNYTILYVVYEKTAPVRTIFGYSSERLFVHVCG